MSLNITACGRCGGTVTETMRFCPACGRKLAQVSRKFTTTFVVVAVGIFGIGVALQSYLIPAKAVQISERHSNLPVVEDRDDPQVALLREELAKDPQNLEKLKMMAGIIGDKLRKDPHGSSPLVFEAIDVLGRILTLSPNDPAALVMMADVSFDQRAFTKAKEFYEKYLALESTNLGARARYASALTFLGEYDASIKQLNTVLDKEPKNFPALAYLAITYAQRGDVPKAKEIGQIALNVAPSDEAKARFSGFVSSLDSAAAADSASAPLPTENSKGVEGFVAQVRANPVAGPKLVGYQDVKEGEIHLVFKDFPMSQMPPFAKEKFFTTLRQAGAAAGLDAGTTVSFIDSATGVTMESLALKAP